MKFRLLLIAVTTIVAGCTSSSIKSSDVESIQYGKSVNEIEIFNKKQHIYRLDYLVNSKTYRFETYAFNDTGKYYAFLFENGKLVGLSRTTRLGATRPKIRDCTLFPADYNLDVNDCLNHFNQEIQSNSIELPYKEISTVDEEDLDAMREQTVKDRVAPVYAILYFGPVGLIVLPVLVAEDITRKNQRKNFKLRLGNKYIELLEYISQLPDKTRDIYKGNGTVYIESDFVGGPIIAFGFYNGKVVWINMDPNAKCSGGGLFGVGENKCVIQ